MMRILIVDDDPLSITYLSEIIREMNIEIMSELSALQALSTFKNNPFDVVITDMRMPEMSGIELLRELRELDPEIKVIIITAHAELENAIEAMNSRGYAFFQKPVDPDALLETLKRIEFE